MVLLEAAGYKVPSISFDIRPDQQRLSKMGKPDF